MINLAEKWDSESIPSVDGEPIEEVKPLALPAFYYGGRAGYAMECNGQYIPLASSGDVRMHLKQHGVHRDDVDSHLCRIQRDNFVAHIGSVAGFPPGIHKAVDSGDKFLVTIGPKIIQPKYGEWGFIKNYFRELLLDPAYPDQLNSFYAWMHQARINLISQKRRPLPVAVFVGPKNCGKTLLIEVVRLFLGGRAASAYRALNGATPFNAAIVGAELLTVDDEIASRDHRARSGFAQGIKLQLFATSVRCESKGREAVNLRPIQAMVVAVNDEAEHLQVLPQLDDSLMDKITLFYCRPATLSEDREMTMAKINEEMPAMIQSMEEYQTPEYLKDTRTGAKAWQHPKVMELLNSISSEERMRELLLQCEDIIEKLNRPPFNWEGSAAEVEKLLRTDPTTRNAAQSLLTWNGACGSYLSKLSASGRMKITSRTSQGYTLWKISN